MNRRRLRPLLWLLVPALLLTGAWLKLRTPVPDAATVEVLEAAAERWWQPGDAVRTIPQAEWPPELRRLAPQQIRVPADGVFLPFGSFFVTEWGLFVLPRRSEYLPEPGGDPSFRHLRDRVYRYHLAG